MGEYLWKILAWSLFAGLGGYVVITALSETISHIKRRRIQK